MKYQQQSPSTVLAQSGSTESLNVLCLDGGGVRGLSSLMILQDIIERLSNQSSPPISLRPCDLFDIICGTSTGGITALMLGRLRMTVRDAIEAYMDFAETVFRDAPAEKHPTYDTPKRRKWIKAYVAHLIFSKAVSEEKKATEHHIFDASKLEEWIKEIVSERTGDKRTFLSDPQGCRTFVVAVRQAHADSPPKLFRSYAADGMPADDCKIWQAARATTAAIPFFKPVTFGVPRRIYFGGDLSGANNPSRLAIQEVESVFPSHKIGCFLSLGTGVPDVISIPQDMRGMADACEKILKSCETVHDETFKVFERRLGDGYFRFSVDRGFGDLPFYEGRETVVADITDGYLDNGAVKKEIKRCVTKLQERVEMNFSLI